jgi:putative tricarboxylic transport membrane protein
MSHDEDRGSEPQLVSTRTMEIVVALLLLAVAGIVIADSLRLGVRWRELEGPGAGYFPFYIGVILAISSAVLLLRAIFDRRGTARLRIFVSKPGFRQVLAVLVPLIAYVASIGFIGIYVASAIYIALFMWHFGRYSPVKGGAIGVAVSLALFAMFEIWFLVPLPKGPVEDFFGF